MRTALGLAGWLVVVFIVAGVASQFMPGPWYAEIRKPAWTPPPWLFGPVWTLLYIAMAVAAWMVWKEGGPRVFVPIGLFVAQLALNGAWSWLFFGLRSPGLALADIVALWALLVATIVAFRAVSVPAASLMIPYLAWVTFASFLNGAIWILNRNA